MPSATPTTTAGSSLNPHPTIKPELYKPFTLQTTTTAILEPSSSSTPGPIRINGSENDVVLSKSKFLTRPEVLNRRSRRLKQLALIYRDQYWSLMQEMKFKHREYYWEYGNSPFVENEEMNRLNSDPVTAIAENNGNLLRVNGWNVDNGNVSSRCGSHGCKVKAMALAKFCHMHILFDGRQKLYKSCEFSSKSSANGPIPCGKPILKTTIPSYCSHHFGTAEKHMVRALKKAGLNVSSTSKVAPPKFHVIVSEFVRHIQQKRQATHKAKCTS